MVPATLVGYKFIGSHGVPPERRERPDGGEISWVVDAVLGASRVLVAVAARSLASVDPDVTLPQFRALVVLASRGVLQPAALADVLGVHPSTATRMCDRLVAKGLITREVSSTNRREVVIGLTPRGRRVVDSVNRRRRKEITAIIESVSKSQRASMVRSLRVFADAAGEVPEEGWPLGWADQ
jgi:DNA-binding MarR family transcriptional regulator